MPLDGTSTENKPDLSFPSLEGLAYLLRHPELWEHNFKFEFSWIYEHFCGDPCPSGCGLGLIEHLYGELERIKFMDSLTNIYGPFSITSVFFKFSDTIITPEILANRIDNLIAVKPIGL